jgi:replicative DNA helicase
MSDLRESGSIEQDADVVAFLHNQNPTDKISFRIALELIIAKNRAGATAIIDVLFDKGLQRITEIQKEEFSN